ncbi:helix-turn-helix domain-containing protein [Promicromonospora sp. NPDC090134]|uniref:helix-turn-helix domain-containing protein n=1 Tax=Promicromonospora sp. NPDC090134 TaxID=3364408 RepID=UPI00381C9D44
MATATPPVYTATEPTVTAVTPLLYRVEEAAEALRLSRTQVYELIRDNELRTVKIGGRRRVPVAAVVEYVKALEGAA